MDRQTRSSWKYSAEVCLVLLKFESMVQKNRITEPLFALATNRKLSLMDICNCHQLRALGGSVAMAPAGAVVPQHDVFAKKSTTVLRIVLYLGDLVVGLGTRVFGHTTGIKLNKEQEC